MHILRQRQRDRAGIRGRGQDAHGCRQRGDQLLGTVDAIPVTRDRLEAIVDADILRVFAFDLLQDGRLNALGEDITRQQQDRYAIDRRHRRARDHIGRARSDGRGASEGRQAVFVLGISDGSQDLRLFVAALVVAEFGRVLFQRLTDAGHVAMAEDAPHAGEEGVLDGRRGRRAAGKGM